MIERHAVACALFAEALRRGGCQDLVAGGQSMLPAVWPGDRLTIQSASPADLSEGDLAAWRSGTRIVVHRVVRVVELPSGPHFITRGDAMPADDDPVPMPAILGRVTRVVRGPFLLPGTGSTSRWWRLSAALFGWWFAARQQVAIRCPAIT